MLYANHYAISHQEKTLVGLFLNHEDFLTSNRYSLIIYVKKSLILFFCINKNSDLWKS